MMGNIMKYKDYSAVIEYSCEDKVLFGKIIGINDLVTFESDSADEIENEFHAAVDDYLAYCKEVGKEPEKEYKGCFNVRISPRLHRELALYAMQSGISLNQAVENAVSEFVVRKQLTDIGDKLGEIHDLTKQGIDLQQYNAKFNQLIWNSQKVGAYHE